MAKVAKNNLGFLGPDFQYKLISAFIEDQKFFKDLNPIIDQNMFTETYLKVIVGVMKEYYAKHDIPASYDMIAIKLREKALSTDDIQCYEEALEKVRKQTTEGIDEVEELSEKFFKQQNWVRVANEIRRIAGDGDMSKYDECQHLIEQANSIGRRTVEITSPLDNIEEDLSKESVVTIPTGILKLDDCLGGGLDKGKIGLIMGPTSFGKVQPYDAKIVTTDGFVKMGEIGVGDKVIGRDGRPHNVIGVFPHKNWQFYRVKFSDGTSCECGKEHLWTVIDKNGLETTLSLGEIIENGLFERNKPKYRIPVSEAITFREKNSDVTKYLERSNNDLFSYFMKRETCEPLNENIVTYFLNKSIHKRIKLLNEVMDRFGSVNKDGYAEIKTGTRCFVDVLSLLIRSLGGLCLVKKHKYDKEYSLTFVLTNSNIKVFTDDDVNSEIKYGLHGDYNKYIVSIDESRVCDGQCIKVDAKDELYLTNDFIVTHNTSMTTAISAYAATYKCKENFNQGFKTLQIVFEDSPRDIHRKYFSRLSQVETSKLNENEETTNRVREILKNHPDRDAINENIKIVQLNTGEYSATDIKRFIKKTINEGFNPDMVVVDYFECVKHEAGTGTQSKWDQETYTMRKFETMAKELNVALWLPTQGNRSSMSADVVGMDQGSGSIGKQQIAQVVISIARSMDDIEQQKATLAVLKNRSGKAGLNLNGIIFNNGTCTISSEVQKSMSAELSYSEDYDI